MQLFDLIGSGMTQADLGPQPSKFADRTESRNFLQLCYKPFDGLAYLIVFIMIQLSARRLHIRKAGTANAWIVVGMPPPNRA
jgi:hypothetical protein